MIALSAQGLYMRPGSTVGAATPVTGGGEKASEKMVSAMRSEFRALADKLGITRWAHVIAPAGYSTLTCYLIPYYVYALGALSGLSMPDALTAGWVGMVKSILFSILIIQLTGMLGNIRIRLKI